MASDIFSLRFVHEAQSIVILRPKTQLRVTPYNGKQKLKCYNDCHSLGSSHLLSNLEESVSTFSTLVVARIAER